MRFCTYLYLATSMVACLRAPSTALSAGADSAPAPCVALHDGQAVLGAGMLRVLSLRLRGGGPRRVLGAADDSSKPKRGSRRREGDAKPPREGGMGGRKRMRPGPDLVPGEERPVAVEGGKNGSSSRKSPLNEQIANIPRGSGAASDSGFNPKKEEMNDMEAATEGSAEDVEECGACGSRNISDRCRDREQEAQKELVAGRWKLMARHLDKHIALFLEEVRSLGDEPGGAEYDFLFRAAIQKQNLDAALSLYTHVANNTSFKPPIELLDEMLVMCQAAGRYGEGAALAQDVLERGYNVSEDIYVRVMQVCNEEGESALTRQLFREMQEGGIEPSLMSIREVLQATHDLETESCEAYASLAAAALQRLTEAGIKPSIAGYNVVIEALIRAGRQEEAEVLMREVNKMSDAGTTAAKRSGADGRDESGAGDSAEESAFRRGGMTADEVAKLYGEEDLTSEPDSASDETGGSSDRIEGVPVFRADPEEEEEGPLPPPESSSSYHSGDEDVGSDSSGVQVPLEE